MKKHANILKPKFDCVISWLNREVAPLEIGQWVEPKGGYFVSFNAMDGCAKRIVQLCKDAGVVLTGAGATYPYGKDPKDSNIRIAPSYPPIDELEKAMELFCICVKLASAEKLLAE
jgi:DNA-binding transcriptional MocR family regulator